MPLGVTSICVEILRMTTRGGEFDMNPFNIIGGCIYYGRSTKVDNTVSPTLNDPKPNS